MSDLLLTLVQTELYWENPLKNRKHFSSLLKKVKRNTTDLILLPEMFNSGFTMNTAMAEDMSGPTVSWMRETAIEKNAVVSGSLIISEKKKFYNRLIWMKPDGTCTFYNKRHLFRMASEHTIFSAGSKIIMEEIKGWKICPLICYDLRFPVWSRNVQEFDLLLYVANWPSRRKYAWKQLLIARAIENQCYVAGLNRTGVDGNQIPYPGLSVILDPLGKKLNAETNATGELISVKLNKNYLEKLRTTFPVLMDSDKFKIEI